MQINDMWDLPNMSTPPVGTKPTHVRSSKSERIKAHGHEVQYHNSNKDSSILFSLPLLTLKVLVTTIDAPGHF